MTATVRASLEDARRFLALLHRPGDVFELRSISKRYRKPHIMAGYFDDMRKLAATAIERSGKDDGVYVTLNPVHRGLLSRLPANRVHQVGSGDATSARDIIARLRLLIDIDPARPAGISSSDEEHAAAIALAKHIAAELAMLGWPEPLIGDSGNGGHLLYAIDLPCDDGGLVKRVLVQLAKRYSTPELKIDEQVFDANRISKIYGTLTRKGQDTAERPHRLARILSAPATLVAVTRAQLEALAPAATSGTSRPSSGDRANGSTAHKRFDLDAWIVQHIPDAEAQPWSGGEHGQRKWLIPTCPFNLAHDRKEACIVEMHSGAISASCKHDSCVWGWRELRERFEPDAYRRDYSGTSEPNGHRASDSDSQPDNDVPPRSDSEAPGQQSTSSKAKWRRGGELVKLILERAKEPWVELRLGHGPTPDVITKVRLGGVAVVMGPTGAGKSSLAAGMLIAHARDIGPVIVLSRELPADEFAGRMIGMQCDASWLDALTGKVPLAEMERVISQRLLILDREHANIPGLVAAIEAMQAEYPGVPILVAIDYLQILESDERDARAKVSDVVSKVDAITRRYRVVTLAISQMSRASSRAARNGEALGADSTDGGAESAAIERTASVTISIGAAGPAREDGTCVVDLSIGKNRMFGGDKVLSGEYNGRTGRWRIAGEARRAADVKAERKGQRDTAKQRNAELAIVSAASKATEPQTRAELGELAGVRNSALRTAAIAALLDRDELVQVAVKASRSTAWKLWTREKATAAGVQMVKTERQA